MNYRAMRYAVEEAEIDGAAWSVLVVIAYRADKTTGLCTTSRRRLAREARVSTSTVHFALEQLIKAGFLAIVLTGSGRRSTTYQVLVPDPPSGSTVEPQAVSPNGSVAESLVVARYGSTTEPLAPVDNSGSQPVVARS